MARVSLSHIEQAVALIERHLDDDLPLEDVAASVGLSRFALHRMFRACVGETLKGYIRKRRLTQAAYKLKDTKQRIIELAMDAGFQSQEAFTRAFQGFFGVTPGQYRRTPKSSYQPGLLPASIDQLTHHMSGLSMTPRLIERQKAMVVHGWGTATDFEDDGPISALWEQLMQQVAALEAPPSTLFGVCQAEHPNIPLTEEQYLTYLAGVSDEAPCLAQQAPLQAIIPPGAYAVFTHDGPLNHVIDTVNYAWATWLPQSNYDKSKRPDLEVIPLALFTTKHPHIEIWISID